MRVAMFDTRRYDRVSFEAANDGHAFTWYEPALNAATAPLAAGHDAVCSFVNDRLDAAALRALVAGGVRLVALRSAGYNHVELAEAARLRLPVVRVPEYSPHAVAEHAVALVLALNRKLHRAHARVREWNFSLEGLVGFDLHGKTVGIVGLGRIGRAAARIFRGFGCRVLGHDVRRDPALEHEVVFTELATLLADAHVVSLHVPLTPATRHLIDADALARVRPGVVIVNTGRGALIDSRALIDALKSGRVGGAGLDVYEEEEGVFFHDLSDRVLQDDVLARLLTFPNVLVTAHQGFLTREALAEIARVTVANLTAFERGLPLRHEVRAADVLEPPPAPH
jgi:D-lactate dehydrogenase